MFRLSGYLCLLLLIATTACRDNRLAEIIPFRCIKFQVLGKLQVFFFTGLFLAWEWRINPRLFFFWAHVLDRLFEIWAAQVTQSVEFYFLRSRQISLVLNWLVWLRTHEAIKQRRYLPLGCHLLRLLYCKYFFDDSWRLRIVFLERTRDSGLHHHWLVQIANLNKGFRLWRGLLRFTWRCEFFNSWKQIFHFQLSLLISFLLLLLSLFNKRRAKNSV